MTASPSKRRKKSNKPAIAPLPRMGIDRAPCIKAAEHNKKMLAETLLFDDDGSRGQNLKIDGVAVSNKAQSFLASPPPGPIKCVIWQGAGMLLHLTIRDTHVRQHTLATPCCFAYTC